MTISDAIQILEVCAGDSLYNISKKYKQLALENHPDKYPEPQYSSAERAARTIRFQKINDAYVLLKEHHVKLGATATPVANSASQKTNGSSDFFYTDAYDFSNKFRKLDESIKNKTFTIHKINLRLIINDFFDLKEIVSILTLAESEELILELKRYCNTLVLDSLGFPSFISSLSVEKYSLIMKYLRIELVKLIHDGSSFHSILQDLNLEDRNYYYNLVKENIPRFASNLWILDRMLSCLNEAQRNEVFNITVPRLHALILYSYKQQYSFFNFHYERQILNTFKYFSKNERIGVYKISNKIKFDGMKDYLAISIVVVLTLIAIVVIIAVGVVSTTPVLMSTLITLGKSVLNLIAVTNTSNNVALTAGGVLAGISVCATVGLTSFTLYKGIKKFSESECLAKYQANRTLPEP